MTQRVLSNRAIMKRCLRTRDPGNAPTTEGFRTAVSSAPSKGPASSLPPQPNGKRTCKALACPITSSSLSAPMAFSAHQPRQCGQVWQQVDNAHNGDALHAGSWVPPPSTGRVSPPVAELQSCSRPRSSPNSTPPSLSPNSAACYPNPKPSRFVWTRVSPSHPEPNCKPVHPQWCR